MRSNLRNTRRRTPLGGAIRCQGQTIDEYSTTTTPTLRPDRQAPCPITHRTVCFFYSHLESVHYHEGVQLQQHRGGDHREHLRRPLEAAESLPPPLAPPKRGKLGQQALHARARGRTGGKEIPASGWVRRRAEKPSAPHRREGTKTCSSCSSSATESHAQEHTCARDHIGEKRRGTRWEKGNGIERLSCRGSVSRPQSRVREKRTTKLPAPSPAHTPILATPTSMPLGQTFGTSPCCCCCCCLSC